MFSSKPVQPVQPVVRTTNNPVLLRQKAIEFLDKNYTRLKNGDTYKNEFYMLEPNSINGIKKVKAIVMFKPKDAKGVEMNPMNIKLLDKQYLCEFTYTDKYNTNVTIKENMYIYRRPDNNDDKAMWYRNISMFGNNASDVVLGGTRRRKSRRRKYRQRKSYKK